MRQHLRPLTRFKQSCAQSRLEAADREPLRKEVYIHSQNEDYTILWSPPIWNNTDCYVHRERQIAPSEAPKADIIVHPSIDNPRPMNQSEASIKGMDHHFFQTIIVLGGRKDLK